MYDGDNSFNPIDPKQVKQLVFQMINRTTQLNRYVL